MKRHRMWEQPRNTHRRRLAELLPGNLARIGSARELRCRRTAGVDGGDDVGERRNEWQVHYFPEGNSDGRRARIFSSCTILTRDQTTRARLVQAQKWRRWPAHGGIDPTSTARHRAGELPEGHREVRSQVSACARGASADNCDAPPCRSHDASDVRANVEVGGRSARDLAHRLHFLCLNEPCLEL